MDGRRCQFPNIDGDQFHEMGPSGSVARIGLAIDADVLFFKRHRSGHTQRCQQR